MLKRHLRNDVLRTHADSYAYAWSRQLEQKNAALNEELQASRVQNETIASAYVKVQEAVTDLSSELEPLRIEKAALEQEVQRLEGVLEDKTQLNTGHTADIDALRKKIAAMADEVRPATVCVKRGLATTFPQGQ